MEKRKNESSAVRMMGHQCLHSYDYEEEQLRCHLSFLADLSFPPTGDTCERGNFYDWRPALDCLLSGRQEI